MRKLDGYNSENMANKNNPVTDKQKAVLDALRFYFEDDDEFLCFNANDAFEIIKKYKPRVDIESKRIYVDGYLIINEDGPVPDCMTFARACDELDIDGGTEVDFDYYDEPDYDIYDPSDMSTWDDDDWIDFELEH